MIPISIAFIIIFFVVVFVVGLIMAIREDYKDIDNKK